MCARVSANIRVSTASNEAFLYPAGSEPFSESALLYPDTQGRASPLLIAWNVLYIWVQHCLDWGPFLFLKCPPVVQTTYSSPETLTPALRMFSLPLLQGPLFRSPFLRRDRSPGFKLVLGMSCSSPLSR